jgi:adenylate cyclase
MPMKAISFKLPFRFHTKIFLVLGAMVCLSILSVLFILQKATENRIQENIRERFQGSRAAFRHLQSLRRQFTVDAIDNLTNSNAQFRSILSTASLGVDGLGLAKSESASTLYKDANLRLNSLLPFLSMYHAFDLFILTTADATLLFSKASSQRFGDDISDLPLFEQFDEKEEAEDVWYSGASDANGFLIPAQAGNAAYHVIAKPVEFRDEFHGVVICGKRMDRDTLSVIKGITGTELALYSIQGLQATTLEPAKAQPLNTVLKTAAFGQTAAIHEIGLDRELFLSMRFPILPGTREEAGGFIILKSYTREIQFLSRLRITFLMAGGIILFVALGFSFLLAKSITKPVNQLARAAKSIGTGDLDTKVHIQTGDEMENLGQAFNDMVKGLREREFIKRTFERYVSPTVAAEIIKNPEMLRLGGHKKKVTIFFTDIGDFSTMSEKFSPEEVVTHLNEYFQGMSKAILDFDGTINQLLGDAIFAYWGAPVDQDDHALRACRAALRCRQFLRELEAKWVAEGLPARTYRFGINTGDVVVGNVGTASRLKYTLIGDNVNLTSRLEQANKYLGTQILISEETYSHIKDQLVAREIDIIRVVGRSKPVTVYELLSEKGGLDANKARSLQRFEAGLEAYRRREWKAAASWFEKVLDLVPEDAPSKVYVQRCNEYLKTPPANDWDGVYELRSK